MAWDKGRCPLPNGLKEATVARDNCVTRLYLMLMLNPNKALLQECSSKTLESCIGTRIGGNVSKTNTLFVLLSLLRKIVRTLNNIKFCAMKV